MIVSDYSQLLLSDTPLIDLRAPVEFARGAFPTAVNLPLLSDTERAQVGTCYKKEGPEAALALGHSIVSEATREDRMQRWVDFCERHPNGALYCFRGGQRSAIVQQWLDQAGVPYPRVAGGYKAMRGFVLSRLEQLAAGPLLLVGGRTGVGKTDLMQELPMALDLEGLAHHRGSSFGRRVRGQPSQIDFENALVIAWMKQTPEHQAATVFEDESHLIGSLAIPEALWKAFQNAPIVVVEEPLGDRIARIRRDFVDSMLEEFRSSGEFDWDAFAQHLLGALDRIAKRLGGARHEAIRQQMVAALEHHRGGNGSSRHELWIETLLHEYYDPMYDYQLDRHERNILFTGDLAAVHEWIHTTARERPESFR